MILRNYDNIVTAIKTNFTRDIDTSAFGDGYLSVGIGDSVFPIYNYSNGTKIPFLNWTGATSSNYSGFYFGSGTTAPTYDDTSMESQYTYGTHFSLVSSSLTQTTVYNEETQCFEKTTKQIFTAITDLTINEIGVRSLFYKNGSSSGDLYALVFREVLETPISVPEGANFIVTFKQNIPANPNKPTDYTATASVE